MAIGSAPLRVQNYQLDLRKHPQKNHLFSCENDEVIWEKVKQSSSEVVEGPAFCTHKRRKHLLSKIVQGFMAKAQQGGR